MQTISQKSSFVTVLAWIFIALSGFGTLIGILQCVMIMTVFNTPEMSQAMQAPAPPGSPALAVFMMKHMVAFFVAVLAVNMLTLASSIGLLLRHEWARRVLIGVLTLGIAWNIAGLALQVPMLSNMRAQFASMPGAPDMGAFFVAILVVSCVFALGFSVLFGWIIKRLVSQPIVAEFAR